MEWNQNGFGATTIPFNNTSQSFVNALPSMLPNPSMDRGSNRTSNPKIINDINEVYPNEVPMDGSWGCFILKDFSKVYLLTWTTNEGIKRIEFANSSVTPSQAQEMDIDSMIETKINRMKKDILKELRNDRKLNNGNRINQVQKKEESVNE